MRGPRQCRGAAGAAATGPVTDAAHRAAERAARESYGRLVAWLAYRWRDLAAAEDALSDAFASALRHWPRTGVPDSPEAWLMAAAQRQLLQVARHRRVEDDPRNTAVLEPDRWAPDLPAGLPDERLKLMFVCAHPALPAAVHAPLMLQAVLGLEARHIASAFLVSPAAMAQRLVRAKARIREAGLRFEVPEGAELAPRLSAVLESLYGAYSIGSHTALQGPDVAQGLLISELTGEALYLTRLVVSLQPDSAEANGLLALMLYCEARRPAQFNAAGQFVPLADQDPLCWRRDLIDEAEATLRAASGLRQPGHFQLEAAIQSAHCQRAFTGHTPWRAVAALYQALVEHFPSTGAHIGHAVALAETGQVQAGWDRLEALSADAVARHQPYWVARAHLGRRLGRHDEAALALDRAIGLTEDPRVRAHLLRARAGA